MPKAVPKQSSTPAPKPGSAVEATNNALAAKQSNIPAQKQSGTQTQKSISAPAQKPKTSLLATVFSVMALFFICAILLATIICPDGSIKIDSSSCEGEEDNPIIYCTPNWQCGAWTDCSSNGKQSRVCTDQNDCGTTTGIPDTGKLCTPACTPSWLCSEWSACSSSKTQTRICTDENDCGVSTEKPDTSQSCASTCTPSWSCDGWSACSSNGMQTRTCTDSNSCGITAEKPPTSQSCAPVCNPSWACSEWSTCSSSGAQTRTCTDNNRCGVNSGRPVETQSCTSGDITTDYHFTYYENKEPYLSSYCDKIDPYNSAIQQATAEAIQNDPGPYSIAQLLDIYDWVKKNIVYQTSPLAGIPYHPSQTLSTRSGDCKNQAVLIASMVKIVGGTAKVVADPDCVHAYTIVYFGSISNGIDSFTRAVADHYGSQVTVNYFTMDGGIWVIFDGAGGWYPGDTLPECSGDRTVYYITGCLSCAHQYPNMPYTYKDMCYERCPSGTVHKNDYSCGACNAGEWAYDNRCVTCQSGYYLATDGLCYPE